MPCGFCSSFREDLAWVEVALEAVGEEEEGSLQEVQDAAWVEVVDLMVDLKITQHMQCLQRNVGLLLEKVNMRQTLYEITLLIYGSTEVSGTQNLCPVRTEMGLGCIKIP